MTITESFYAVLNADAGLTALTSEIHNAFIPPQTEAPAVTFSLAEDLNDQTLSGIGCTNTALIDVDCWARRLVDAESVATAVKTLLVDYNGAFQGLTVSYISKQREIHLEETDTGLRRVSMQFQILYGA